MRRLMTLVIGFSSLLMISLVILLEPQARPMNVAVPLLAVWLVFVGTYWVVFPKYFGWAKRRVQAEK